MSGNAANKNGNPLNLQASKAEAVTPDDGTDLPNAAYGLYIGGAGNIVVDMLKTGTSITFANVLAGTFLPLMVKRVRATGTTATNIVALY